MKREYRKIINTTKFQCKNKELEATVYTCKNYDGNQKEVWEITDKKEYISSVDYYPKGFSGESLKFYQSDTGKKLKSINELINFWKTRYIFPNLSTAMGNRKEKRSCYSVDLYDLDKKEFDELMKNVNFLLNKNAVIHYNDEHGVGYFEKVKGKKKFKTTHCRWGTENIEWLDIEEIASFLRNFFDIGYSRVKENEW